MAALAPARRAVSPSPSRATGRRWARTTASAVGLGPVRPVPAAQEPEAGGRGARRVPSRTDGRPGRAPERSRGPASSGPDQRAEHRHRDQQLRRLDRSPPTTAQPGASAAAASPVPRAVEIGAGRRGHRHQGESRAWPPWRPGRRRPPSEPSSPCRRGPEVEVDVDPRRPPGRWPTRPARPGGRPSVTTAASSPIQTSPEGGQGPPGPAFRPRPRTRLRSRSMAHVGHGGSPAVSGPAGRPRAVRRSWDCLHVPLPTIDG